MHPQVRWLHLGVPGGWGPGLRSRSLGGAGYVYTPNMSQVRTARPTRGSGWAGLIKTHQWASEAETWRRKEGLAGAVDRVGKEMGPPFGKRAARSTAEASNVLDEGPWADGSQNLSAKGTGLGTLQKREGIVGKQHPGRPRGRAELCPRGHTQAPRLLLGPVRGVLRCPPALDLFVPLCWLTFRRSRSVIFLTA